jgi:hypothetical protein
MSKRAILWCALTAGIVAATVARAQVTTVCSLYGSTAQCTSTDQGTWIAEQQREQYETGQAIGRGIGMAIFRAHFPGWRRKYCSKHPSQPFVYANAAGDSITGTCPNAEGLANEVASEWVAKHPAYQPTPADAKTMTTYIGDHHLSFVEKKSYDQAYQYLKANGPRTASPVWVSPDASRKSAQKNFPVFDTQGARQAGYSDDEILKYLSQAWNFDVDRALKAGYSKADIIDYLARSPAARAAQSAPSAQSTSGAASSVQDDLFVWFDEPAPAPGAPLFEAMVTSQAYDGALALLRQARQGNTSVQAGISVLDTNYHPSTVSLGTWRASHPQSAPALFYWKGEQVSQATPVMHFQMTRRAYEQMLAITAGSDLRMQPAQAGGGNK